MNKTNCFDCKKELPLNESFLYNEQPYCEECLNTKIKNGLEIKKDEVIKQIDNTVCVNCNFDNGNHELKKIANLPVCDNCYISFINRPFPQWIKLSAVALFFIVLFGLYYNSKYLMAYLSIRESRKSIQTGKLEDAYINMSNASNKLPHLGYLKGLTDFYEGIYRLNNDESEKALSLFESYKKYYPDDKSIDPMILHAKSGVYYDTKDFQNFYLVQKELYKLNPDDVISIAGISSGAACLYITTKDKKYKDEMIEYFELARKKMVPEQEKELTDYIQRIKYRVYSGEIIDTKEYYERFPDGWKGDIK